MYSTSNMHSYTFWDCKLNIIIKHMPQFICRWGLIQRKCLNISTVSDKITTRQFSPSCWNFTGGWWLLFWWLFCVAIFAWQMIKTGKINKYINIKIPYFHWEKRAEYHKDWRWIFQVSTIEVVHMTETFQDYSSSEAKRYFYERIKKKSEKLFIEMWSCFQEASHLWHFHDAFESFLELETPVSMQCKQI